MIKVNLNIHGMACDGCVASVKRVLAELKGVQHAEVSLEDHCAVVEFDEHEASVTQLIDAIDQAGFDVSVC